MNYISKNPVLTRSGSTPRVISYTLPTTERTFSYQTPKKQNVDLIGNLNKKVNPPESKEDSIFRKVKKSEEPNTNRTLNPDLAPEPKEKSMVRSQSVQSFRSGNMTPSNINSLIYNDREMNQHTHARKATNPRVYQSFSFVDESPKIDPYKRNLKKVEFKKYDNTTQIVSLPGGVKRSEYDIHDDNKPANTKSSLAHSTKLVRDYNSNISCLPGSFTNSHNVDRSLLKQRKFQTSDIFNTNPTTNQNQNVNYNSFKVSNKKTDSSRIFGTSNNEKNLIPYTKAHRPNQIRNVFESQFSII